MTTKYTFKWIEVPEQTAEYRAELQAAHDKATSEYEREHIAADIQDLDTKHAQMMRLTAFYDNGYIADASPDVVLLYTDETAFNAIDSEIYKLSHKLYGRNIWQRDTVFTIEVKGQSNE